MFVVILRLLELINGLLMLLIVVYVFKLSFNVIYVMFIIVILLKYFIYLVLWFNGLNDDYVYVVVIKGIWLYY